jgi:hypothetical protein
MNFESHVTVNRLLRSDDDPVVIGYSADIKVNCIECGEKFVWKGAPTGMGPDGPMVSIDGTELRAPLVPDSAPDGFGDTMLGFAVKMRIGEGRHDG